MSRRQRSTWYLLAASTFLLAILPVFFHLTRTDAIWTSRPPENITIAVSTSLYPALVKIAEVKGFFKAQGVDVKLIPFTSGRAALQCLLEEKADLATVAETPIMFAVLDGARLSTLATIETSMRNEAIVGRKDLGVASGRDLKGRRIGVPLGTTADYFLDTYLVLQGIARDHVTVVDLKPEELVGALLSGRVEAISGWNPHIANLRQTLDENATMLHGQDIYTGTFNLVSRRGLYDTRAQAAQQVLRALLAAEAFATANPEECQAIMSEFSNVDRGLLATFWNDFQFSVSLNQSLVFTLESQSRWAVRTRLTEQIELPNFLESIEPAALRAVKTEVVRLIR